MTLAETVEADLSAWYSDGAGSVAALDGGYELQIETPYTLWCPAPADGDCRFEFECAVCTPNSAMLFLACARNWQGGPFFDGSRDGNYDNYSSEALACYTIGFNRTAHVTNDEQPNASTANIRRLGGAESHQQFTAAKLRPDGQLDHERWEAWNRQSLLASARELHSGLNCFFHYEFIFSCPYIRILVEGEELMTVVDHKSQPLQGGYFGIRNMTPGATCRVRRFSASPASVGAFR